MHIAAKSIELGHGYRATLPARLTKCCGQLRATLDCVSAFASLYLNEYAAQRKALGGCKALKSFLLRLKAKS